MQPKGALSHAQQGIRLFERTFPGTLVQHVAAVVQVAKDASAQQLVNAWRDLTFRHAALRVGIDSASPPDAQAMILHDPESIRGMSCSDVPEEELQGTLQAAAIEAFALDGHEPLVQARAFFVAGRATTVLVRAHRLAADWTTLTVVVREFLTRCSGESMLDPSAGEGPSDVCPQQSRPTATFDSHHEWWRDHLRGGAPVLQLPSVGRRSASRSFEAAAVSVAMPAGLVKVLAAAGAAEPPRAAATVLAPYAATLLRYAGQDEVVVGWNVPLHESIDRARTPGPRENWLPLRLASDPDITYGDFAQRVHETASEAWARRDVPFDLLLRDAGVAVRSSLPPLIQAQFELRRAVPGISEWPLPQMPFELHLVATVGTETGELSLRYNTELFNEHRARAFLDHCCQLWASGAADPECPVARLQVLGDQEHRHLVHELNRTWAPYASDRCLHDLVSSQARRTPKATAYIFEGRHCSYAEVDRWSLGLAGELALRGIGKGHFVPLLMDRSLELPVAMLGVMKAGAAFVPMDVHWPAQRIEHIVRDTGSPIVVVCDAASLADRIPEGVQVYEFDVDRVPLRPPRPEVMYSSEDPIYMIYTSGSTGVPKGAINKHRGIVNRLSYMTRRYGCTPQDIILQTSAHIFDAAVWQYFWPLINGASSVLPSPMVGFDHRHITDLIGTYGVTVTDFVPSVFNVLVDIVDQDEELRTRLATLRQILIGGEALSPKAIYRFLQIYPQASITNTYGPTETSIGVIFYEVGKAYEDPLPIGRPIANVNAYILDEHLQPVPVGVPGMLHVGGDCVGMGYHHDPVKTAAAFLDNPFPEVHPGKIYRTGDLARYRESGDIEFLGRADHQVKIRGVRIELGEIEARLHMHPAVRAAVVSLWEPPDGSKRLAAYIVQSEGAHPGNDELRSFLRESLPEYVIPNAFVRLPQLPLLRSGKVDRKSLPPPNDDVDASRPAGPPPRTNLQKQLAAAWTAELRLSAVSIHDNFFELGGDSLAALKVLAQLELEHGIKLEAEQMMIQSLGQLAASLGDVEEGAAAAAEGGTGLPTAVEPFFFGDEARALFGCSTRGPGVTKQAVVTCAPLGHEYLFTHRSLRHMAQLLATRSHPVLRFDYHGTGDSAGEPVDVRIASCVADAGFAIAEAAERFGVASVAVVGLRFGAAVATRSALASPHVNRVVLWDPIVDGVAYLREVQAIHERMTRREDAPSADAAVIELAGFPMSRALWHEVKSLGRDEYRGLVGRQVLLLDSTERRQQEPLAEWLRELNIDVEYVQIPYPEIWNQDPYKTRLPTRIIDAVCQWIDKDRA